jgi:hypothetical protein
MRRRWFTTAAFVAVLVGCAASAMRTGGPLPAGASNATTHVRGLTDAKCYYANGTDCASTYHVVWGQVTFLTSACDNLTWCAPATYGNNTVTFTNSAVFTEVPVCEADEGAPGPYLVNALPENTENSVTVMLYNASGGHLDAQTMTHTFQCEGI